MPVYRTNDGRWRYREVIVLPDGRRERVSGSAPKQTNSQAAAKEALRQHADRLLNPERAPRRHTEVPTFRDWFKGRFWTEHVIANRNKPTEVRTKQQIFDKWLDPAFGDVPLNEIDAAAIARFRATLVQYEKPGAPGKAGAGLSPKRINNILAVLSKPLHYAAESKVIAAVPKIGIFKVEPPEIVPWEVEEYQRILAAARGFLGGGDVIEGGWYAAVCLAGEAGLRSGEVKALQWEHVDLVGGTVTVAEQTCLGVTTTPKGRTRRKVPMTATLRAALEALPVVPREGYVVRNVDGSALGQVQMDETMRRIVRRTGLPSHRRTWHALRHTFATDCARYGVNPWTLQNWLGHKRIEETMRYVHVAQDHWRETPEEIRDALVRELDPDRRIVAALGARGKGVPKSKTAESKLV
jgi:integrase